MIEKLDVDGDTTLGFRISGVVGRDDYTVLVPEVTDVVEKFGKVNLLLDLRELKWEKVTAWGSDLRFGKEFHGKVERLAVVGDGLLQKFVADLAKPFYAKAAQRFATVEEGREWLAD